jgi:CRP/FNR family transcriptional regulator, cyclic AMP receptor protein
MSTAIVDVLGRSDAFCSLDEAERARLASACHARAYAAGQMVFLRGDDGDCMYVVASGAVSISLSGDAGRDVLLAVLGPYASFGELAVVDSGPRTRHCWTCRDACRNTSPRLRRSETARPRPERVSSWPSTWH